MKHLLYVSEISQPTRGPMVPKGLLDIYRIAKTNNKAYDIGGVLAYRAGHYLQVIEGNDTIVNLLYRKILRDTRHQNVALVIENECKSRVFSGWRFESALDLSRNAEFRAFMDTYRSELTMLPHAEKEMISVFYEPFWETYFEAPAFENTTLKLIQWPKLVRIGQSPEIVNFCTSLLQKPHAYEELIESKKFGHNFDLNQALLEFKDQGTLEILKNNSPSSKIAPTIIADGFLQKMRSFLSAHN